MYTDVYKLVLCFTYTRLQLELLIVLDWDNAVVVKDTREVLGDKSPSKSDMTFHIISYIEDIEILDSRSKVYKYNQT